MMHTMSTSSTLTRLGLVTAGALAFLAPECLRLVPSAVAQATPPDTITLTAIVRDFRGIDEPGGHPDFERNKALHAGGLTQGAVAPFLGTDGKPVFTWGTKVKKGGTAVYKQWMDAAGRPIAFAMYDQARGDSAGEWDTKASLSAFTSGPNFDQWYRDIPGVNLSTTVTLTLMRQADGTYVFDDKTDSYFKTKGGFFPIDGQLFGNSAANPSHNYHFTTELHTRFTYDAGIGQIFKFTGDDDIWVFVDGRLVIDLGGTHGPVEQFVDMTRLGLVDGQKYTLDIFHAERQTNGSNFRFQTDLFLEEAGALSTITNPFD